jgi:tetratricopeptide (TPR) repeat protein
VRSLPISHVALLAVLTSCTVTGCAVPGWGGAKQPESNQTSWTEKATAPFKSLAPKKKPTSVVNALPPGQDPISLGFSSGPATPALYVSMGQMSDQGGNTDHARAMYQKALTMDPKNLDGLLSMARLEDREGNLQLALQFYQQAVSQHPQDGRALNDLALCHARCGQMSTSLGYLDQAVRICPDKQLYRNNIAKVLIEMNQLDPAVAHLSAVYEPAVANYNMAVLLQERGRTDEAVSFLNRALAANPQMTEASTLLANLTNTAPEQTAVASTRAPGSPIASVSEKTYDDITPTPYQPGETAVTSYSYPSTGVPPMIPKPQAIPAETASVPVGHEPMLLPAIR